MKGQIYKLQGNSKRVTNQSLMSILMNIWIKPQYKEPLIKLILSLNERKYYYAWETEKVRGKCLSSFYT